MKSRTSFCNGTLFWKNMTRFAPVWGAYLLCLLLGLVVMYVDRNDRVVNFWFASHMAECIQVMGVVNLAYGPVVAQLLFGDLYNSRMCNALHAMPIRRETYFVTNVLSGIAASVVPTAVMALLSMPLLMNTIVRDAWLIALLWFVAANLQFICFFGMAVFCVFCTGNRLIMLAVYAVLNAGAFLVWFVVDTVYTPMLFGVITPDRLVEMLTPIHDLATPIFVEVENYHDMMALFEGREAEAVAKFWVNPAYGTLFIWALVGFAFMIAGLLMYRKRDLECAGDAVAFPVLAPVFQVICSLGGCGMAGVVVNVFFGYSHNRGSVIMYTVLACGLAVGWFVGKMFLERSTRVFRLKNWVGLGVLAAATAMSLLLTFMDVLGIETWVPKAEKVASVDFMGPIVMELTEREDIEKVISVHRLALEDRISQQGQYPVRWLEENYPDFRFVEPPEEGFRYGEEGEYDENEPHKKADNLWITYTLTSGRQVQRRYNIWTDQEEGQIVRAMCSDWDLVWNNAFRNWGTEPEKFDINQVYSIDCGGETLKDEQVSPGLLKTLLEALRADCEEQNLVPDYYYHTGAFQFWDEESQQHYYSHSRYMTIWFGDRTSRDYAVKFQIYPDSANTLAWMERHGLGQWEVNMDKDGW